MTRTIPATNIGQTGPTSIAYGLFILPSEALQKEITALLADIEAELPGIIWPMPPTALHFTVYEIIQPKEYSEDKEVLYQRNQQAYEDLPEKILASVGPIEVNFNSIEASPYAIIVRGEDDGTLNKVRKQIITELPIIAESKMPPDIIHSSIARYVKEEDFERVQKVIQKYSFNFTETVTEIKLLKNVKFPLLEYETVRTYRLG